MPPTKPTNSSTRTNQVSRWRSMYLLASVAHAHGEEVHPDHQRELGDAVAEQVAGHRARDQLVDEPAGGDHEHRGEEQRLVQVFTSLHGPTMMEMAAAMMIARPARG